MYADVVCCALIPGLDALFRVDIGRLIHGVHGVHVLKLLIPNNLGMPKC